MTERDYNECVHQYADAVFRFTIKNIRHEEDAKDIVQTTFEKLWRNLEHASFDTAKSYLFTIAYNLVRDRARRNQVVDKRKATLFKVSDTTTFQPHTQLKKHLNEALQQLNELQRSLVLLKDYEGYSYQEIAGITGLNEGQVKVYLHRARLILKNYLVKTENLI